MYLSSVNYNPGIASECSSTKALSNHNLCRSSSLCSAGNSRSTVASPTESRWHLGNSGTTQTSQTTDSNTHFTNMRSNIEDAVLIKNRESYVNQSLSSGFTSRSTTNSDTSLLSAVSSGMLTSEACSITPAQSSKPCITEGCLHTETLDASSVDCKPPEKFEHNRPPTNNVHVESLVKRRHSLLRQIAEEYTKMLRLMNEERILTEVEPEGYADVFDEYELAANEYEAVMLCSATKRQDVDSPKSEPNAVSEPKRAWHQFSPNLVRRLFNGSSQDLRSVGKSKATSDYRAPEYIPRDVPDSNSGEICFTQTMPTHTNQEICSWLSNWLSLNGISDGLPPSETQNETEWKPPLFGRRAPISNIVSDGASSQSGQDAARAKYFRPPNFNQNGINLEKNKTDFASSTIQESQGEVKVYDKNKNLTSCSPPPFAEGRLSAGSKYASECASPNSNNKLFISSSSNGATKQNSSFYQKGRSKDEVDGKILSMECSRKCLVENKNLAGESFLEIKHHIPSPLVSAPLKRHEFCPSSTSNRSLNNLLNTPLQSFSFGRFYLGVPSHSSSFNHISNYANQISLPWRRSIAANALPKCDETKSQNLHFKSFGRPNYLRACRIASPISSVLDDEKQVLSPERQIVMENTALKYPVKSSGACALVKNSVIQSSYLEHQRPVKWQLGPTCENGIHDTAPFPKDSAHRIKFTLADKLNMLSK